MCSAGFGMLKFLMFLVPLCQRMSGSYFKYNNPSTFTDDKAISISVKRPTRLCGPIVELSSQTSRSCEPRYCERVNARFGATSNHNVGITKLNHARCIANAVCTCCTSCGSCVIWSLKTSILACNVRHKTCLEAIAHRDVACCEVDEKTRDKERGHFPVALSTISGGHLTAGLYLRLYQKQLLYHMRRPGYQCQSLYRHPDLVSEKRATCEDMACRHFKIFL
jgi:hypothetical protein